MNCKWGDVKLKTASDGIEYLEVNERQTKTRTGQNLADIRKVPPRMYATGDDRCPVAVYKAYGQRRPSNFSNDSDPFYIAPNTKLTTPSDTDR